MTFRPELTRRPLAASAAVLARAREVIPGASQTLSKGPTQWAQGVAPNFIVRGRGARVWDIDGNEYLDWPMALGPVLLGYAHEGVNRAISEQLAAGITFTLPHPLEVDVAERVIAAVPSAERVRFAKSGSDVTSAAVRLARAVTGRERVLASGYHGWHDWYVGATSRHVGVPRAVRELIDVVPFADLTALRAALERRAGEVACVVLEPAGATEPPHGYLQGVVATAHEHGALVIFDEIVTGFRFSMGGAQAHYGADPDLTCFGKALGNGMPVSALAGRAQHMDVLDEVFFSGTHGGEALSLAAANATLQFLEAERVHEHLWRLGNRLQTELRALITRHGVEEWVTCSGAAPWTLVLVREPHPDDSELPAKTLLQQELLKRGVLYNGSHFVSWSHTDADIDETLAAYDAALAVLAAALPDEVARFLEAPPVAQVFRRVQ